MYEIKIEWEGPFKVQDVINQMNRGGAAPHWNGEDYGIYQIYGEHTLNGKDTLLYIGITTERTFSQRFKEHQVWLNKDQKEENVNIYLGRTYDPARHLSDNLWEKDVKIAEKIMIYKYSPNYNSRELTNAPDLSPHEKIRLLHVGDRGKLEADDNAPDDFFI